MQLLPAWTKGCHEFNQHLYWEAHEHWEQGWRHLSEPERTWVQGWIQLAGALHLERLGRIPPADRLRTSALAKLERVWDDMQEVEPRIVVSGGVEFLRGQNPGRLMQARVIKQD